MIWKVLLGCSIILNIVVALFWFDLAISLDGARSQASMLRDRASVALVLLNACYRGKPIDHLEDLFSDQEAQKVIVKIEGDALIVHDIIFSTKGGLVEEVEYFGE